MSEAQGPPSDVDHRWLRRAVDLAAAALAAGDEPFGSVLVGPDGELLAEERNRVGGGDHTRHPELALAQWAAAHVPPGRRAGCTVYTSGEHCPMCAAAHAWNGLGPIVYASSAAQLAAWLAELGAPPAPVATLPVRVVAPGVEVRGPSPSLAGAVRDLHRRAHPPRPGVSPTATGGHEGP